METKSQVKFCWSCGKKLWNTKLYVKVSVHGHDRVLHKTCAKELSESEKVYYQWPEKQNTLSD